MPTDPKEYAAAWGTRCPHCDGNDLSGEQFTVEEGKAWQPIKCHGCGASWNDLYTLTGYETTQAPDADEEGADQSSTTKASEGYDRS